MAVYPNPCDIPVETRWVWLNNSTPPANPANPPPINIAKKAFCLALIPA